MVSDPSDSGYGWEEIWEQQDLITDDDSDEGNRDHDYRRELEMEQAELLTRLKRTHKYLVLQALRNAGRFGVFGHVLAGQDIGGHRFGEYIRQLRSEGHSIKMTRLTGNVTRYILEVE